MGLEPEESEMFIKVGAIIEAARYVEREWGERYFVESVDGSTATAILGVCAGDGSRFFVASDEYGSFHVEDDTLEGCVAKVRTAELRPEMYAEYVAACEEENLDAHDWSMWLVHGQPAGPLG